MQPPEHSPRDLTDRVFRKTLENVENLAEFLQEALPQHAAAFDCAKARLLTREFVSGDWRSREADLLFEIPYRTAGGTGTALVCLLIEHQTRTDPLMPFRTLHLMVSFWDRQWRDWHQAPGPGTELRLMPVIPIVLYTKPTPWGSARRLTDLLAEPAAFHPFAPQFEPLFWNLSEHTPDELLGRGGGWRNLLAVVRAVKATPAEFRRVVAEAVRHLGGILEKDRPRWQELVEALLIWSYANRKEAEYPALQAEAAAQLSDTLHRQEFLKMSVQTGETIYGRGVREGRAEGQLLSLRDVLQELLAKRFGALSEAVKQRIDTATDPDRLRRAVVDADQLKSLDELVL